MIIIKVNTKTDADICDALLTELIQNEKTFENNIKSSYVVKDNYSKALGENQNLLMAIVDGKPAGFIFGFIKFEKGEFCHESMAKIDALYVKEEFRNQGIATKLIEEFNNWCISKNVIKTEIGVFKKNESAFILYKKLGFEETTIYLSKKL